MAAASEGADAAAAGAVGRDMLQPKSATIPATAVRTAAMAGHVFAFANIRDVLVEMSQLAPRCHHGQVTTR